MKEPTQEHIEGFFLGLAEAMKLIENHPDCKTAWRIINRERMTLLLHKEAASEQYL